MQMKTALLVLSLTLLLLVSCAPKPKAMPQTELPPAAADQAVSEIGSSVSEADALDKEMASLDAMDADLAELDSMDLS